MLILAQQSEDNLVGGLLVLGGILVVGLVIYFLPTLLAFLRDAPDKLSVLVVNGLLGWTLIGWVVALAMALRDRRR